ncbi:hypothetical protein GFL92_00985 [Rhizobium leguminosarum bv. viciae]|nr:hypothetical protein [Rhizobium leguminosarum bv. viciae]
MAWLDAAQMADDHACIANEFPKMAYFSIGLDMVATIYIQANSLSDAQGRLQPLFSKQIDARDGGWFSDASFDSLVLPEISFATGMEIRGPVPGGVCQDIDATEVDRLMCSWPDARKCAVLPRLKDRSRGGLTSVYWADLLVRTTGIMKFARLPDALALLADLPRTRPAVHWEVADEWFESKGFENTEFPLVLSPNIEMLAVSDALPLQEHWSVPERMKRGAGHSARD